MTINALDQLSEKEAFQQLFNCCGSTNWVNQLLRLRPFKNESRLFELANKCWFEDCTPDDWLEAFTHHPKIGDVKSLEKKFADTKHWAGNEQAGVKNAQHETLVALAKGNEDYEAKFGYIFIVCATGKSATEMLNLLQQRLPNDAATELEIAMMEQQKITNIILEKLLNNA